MVSSNGYIFRVTGHLCGGEFPAQRLLTRSFVVFFDLRLAKRLSKQWWGWWFKTPLWRHRNGWLNICCEWQQNISAETSCTNTKHREVLSENIIPNVLNLHYSLWPVIYRVAYYRTGRYYRLWSRKRIKTNSATWWPCSSLPAEPKQICVVFTTTCRIFWNTVPRIVLPWVMSSKLIHFYQVCCLLLSEV